MYVENLFDEGLGHPTSALTYRVSRTLASLHPKKAILGTASPDFSLDRYVAASQCLAVEKPSIYCLRSAYWLGPEHGYFEQTEDAWFEISWQGQRIEVVLMSWPTDMCRTQHHWIIADSEEVARSFFLAVCEWGNEIGREILIFEGGGWERSEELYEAIKVATFDNLILGGCLKQAIREDFVQFFAARETYGRYHVPWKRGILFMGPPGNGKTHAVKAL